MQSIHNSLYEAYMKNSQGTGISKSRVKEDFQLCKKWDLLLSMEIAQKARRTNMKRARQEALAPRKTKAKEMQLAKRLEHSIICRQSNKTLKHNREDIYVKRKSYLFAKHLGEACKPIIRGANKRFIQAAQNLVLNNFRE